MTLTPEEIQQLQEREAAFRTALEFYSNRYHWKDFLQKEGADLVTAMEQDTGDKAREALARYPEAKDKE